VALSPQVVAIERDVDRPDSGGIVAADQLGQAIGDGHASRPDADEEKPSARHPSPGNLPGKVSQQAFHDVRPADARFGS
jgi:hypothetical protein